MDLNRWILSWIKFEVALFLDSVDTAMFFYDDLTKNSALLISEHVGRAVAFIDDLTRFLEPRLIHTKGGFFRKLYSFFKSQKKKFQITVLSLKFE